MKHTFFSKLFVSLVWLAAIGVCVSETDGAAQTPPATMQMGGIVIVPSLEKPENARPLEEKDFTGYVMVYFKDPIRLYGRQPRWLHLHRSQQRPTHF
jgi:hypothetical protein